MAWEWPISDAVMAARTQEARNIKSCATWEVSSGRGQLRGLGAHAKHEFGMQNQGLGSSCKIFAHGLLGVCLNEPLCL